MAINDRIKEIRKEFCNNSTKLFAQKLGISSQAISNYIRDGYNIGREVIENILNVYPNIDANWLITGKGEMLKPTENSSRNVHNEGSISGSVSTGDNHTSINGGVSVGNDSTSKSSDNEQRILLLENEVKYLNELLAEKERIIQVLLKNS